MLYKIKPVTPGLALSTNPCSLQAIPNLLQKLGDSCKEPWPGTSTRPHKGLEGWEQVDPKPSTAEKTQAKAGCLQLASLGLAGHSPEALHGSQGGLGPMGETRTPLPLPCPQSPAVGEGGTFWPSQQHIQETASTAPSPSKDPQVMGLVVLIPLWPSTAGGRSKGCTLGVSRAQETA